MNNTYSDHQKKLSKQVGVRVSVVPILDESALHGKFAAWLHTDVKGPTYREKILDRIAEVTKGKKIGSTVIFS